KVERDSELSHWHETVGPCRLLFPDTRIIQWPKQEFVKWTTAETYHSSLRSSCPLSEAPRLTVFRANALPQDREACWLVFEPALIPERERDWYTPDTCVAAKSLLSFLCGKRLSFLWLDRFVDETHLTRTYLGTGKIDDLPEADVCYQPAPL